MTVRVLGLPLLAFIAFLGTGCATAIRGDSQKLRFQTEPPGATVVVDGTSYKAPVSVKLKRNKEHTIGVSAPDHQAIMFIMKAQWDGWSLGNIIMPGGSVGFGIDTVSGADKSFGSLAVIKLNKVSEPSSQPTTMYHFLGRIVTKDDYDRMKKEEQEYRSRTPD